MIIGKTWGGHLCQEQLGRLSSVLRLAHLKSTSGKECLTHHATRLDSLTAAFTRVKTWVLLRQCSPLQSGYSDRQSTLIRVILSQGKASPNLKPASKQGERWRSSLHGRGEWKRLDSTPPNDRLTHTLRCHSPHASLSYYLLPCMFPLVSLLFNLHVYSRILVNTSTLPTRPPQLLSCSFTSWRKILPY